eukprot:3593368-Prymnesium_polylepis.1
MAYRQWRARNRLRGACPTDAAALVHFPRARVPQEFPIITIEDPFDQDDWDAWTKMTADLSCQIVGDDLTVTNVERVKTAIEKKVCTCERARAPQAPPCAAPRHAVRGAPPGPF